MPIRLEDIEHKPTMFDALKGKSVTEVFEFVIEAAFRELAGEEIGDFIMEGRADGTKEATKEKINSQKK